MDALRCFALVVAIAIGGCLGSTPDERRAAEIGTDPPEGPEHNPGNDCSLCHDFAVAGTVYLRATDATGLGGARLEITDAQGRSFEAITNPAGNFYVEVESGEGGFSVRDEGRTELGFDPAFPLHVRVTHGALEQEMVTSIHRERACNACHAATPGADSVGRVYLEAAP